MSGYVIRLDPDEHTRPSMDHWLAKVAELPQHPHLNLRGAYFLAEVRREAGAV